MIRALLLFLEVIGWRDGRLRPSAVQLEQIRTLALARLLSQTTRDEPERRRIFVSCILNVFDDLDTTLRRAKRDLRRGERLMQQAAPARRQSIAAQCASAQNQRAIAKIRGGSTS